MSPTRWGLITALSLVCGCGNVAGDPADAGPSVSPLCGNGALDRHEVCDDGNDQDGDACPATCQIARCGDGFVRVGVEDCDDGNLVDGDGCASNCQDCDGDNQLVWPGNDHCYTRHDDKLVWTEARAACETFGGHLATFSTPGEYEAASALVREAEPIAIGLTDGLVEGTFLWVTGEPFVFSYWSKGNPDNTGGTVDPPTPGEDCVAIDLAKAGWNDFTCEAHEFLCEDDGWLVDPADGHAYRVVHAPLTWAAAKERCEALGAHLATLTGARDNAFLAERVYGFSATHNSTWIGGTRDAPGGDFGWITGEPFDHLEWMIAQPDNAGTGEACLELVAHGGWNDRLCDIKQASLCEIDAQNDDD